MYIWTTVNIQYTEPPNALNLIYADHLLIEVETINFLGLQLDNPIIWKKYIQLLLRKWSSSCFLKGRIYYILNIDSLKLVYFAHFHSPIKDGIIIWGNQHDVNKIIVFQTRVLGIMLGLGYSSSCRAWFKQFEILSVPCQYTYSTAMFEICNYSYFKTNFSVQFYAYKAEKSSS